MFDIGWQELFVLAVLFIIVIGPKDMPGAVRAITKWIRKARSMARDLQDGLDEVVREADLVDLKNEIGSAGGLDVAKRIGEAVDPTGDIAADLDLDKDVYDEMSGALDDLKESTAPDASEGKDDEASQEAAPEKPAAKSDTPDKAEAEAPKPARKKASG